MANVRKRMLIEEQKKKREHTLKELFKRSKKENRLQSGLVYGNSFDQELGDKLHSILLKQRSRLLEYKDLHSSVKSLITFSDFHIRDLEDLNLKGKSPKKHFDQLVDHLLVKYPMPTFFYKVWYDESFGSPAFWKNWFVQLAQGSSVKETSPIKLTKKQAHRFMNSPSKYHPAQALRRVQYLDEGGNPSGLNGIFSCSQIMNIVNVALVREEFSLELIRWFARQNMLDPRMYNDIADWAYNRKFIAEDRQPNLSMKKRDAQSVLREVRRWHNQLNRIRINTRDLDIKNESWKGIHVEDWHFDETFKKQKQRWSVVQITTGIGLMEEGTAMRHCVVSYCRTCKEGFSSIWSLRKDNEKLITLEIRRNNICQAKGKYNRRPTDKELIIIDKFAVERGLSVSSYIGH